MIKINVIFVHGIEFSTFTEKLREIGDRPKFALSVLTRSVSQHFYGDSILKQQRHFTYLGVVVDESLPWNNHVSYVASRVYPKLKLLSRISSFLSPEILLKIYKTTNLPIWDYGCIVWGFCSKKNSDFLERLQNKAMRIILRKNHLACTQAMRERDLAC